MSNIFIGLKKTCLGVLDREERDKYNKTGLKERRVIKISTTVLSITRCTLLRLNYLPFETVHVVGISLCNLSFGIFSTLSSGKGRGRELFLTRVASEVIWL